MRPTISEQLAGIRRILAEVIAPEVTGAYPADMLRGIESNLAMLERSWTSLAPFLAWDNAETARVLRDVAPIVDIELREQIGRLLALPSQDAIEVDALDTRNSELRELLAVAIPQLAGGGDRTTAAYAGVRAHLRERIDRFPLTLSAPMPGAAR